VNFWDLGVREKYTRDAAAVSVEHSEEANQGFFDMACMSEQMVNQKQSNPSENKSHRVELSTRVRCPLVAACYSHGARQRQLSMIVCEDNNAVARVGRRAEDG
jgi:hypothetical protein